MPLLLLIAAAIVVLLQRIRPATAINSPASSPTPPGEDAGTSYSDYGPLDAFTEAWAHFEGADQPGSIAQRYNNPVNIKGSWTGVTGHTPAGIAEFSDPSFGWGAAESYVQEQAQEHPDWSIRQFFAKVLGSLSGQDVNNDQGNSVNESDYVASQLGVPSSANLAAYIEEQSS